MDKAGSALQAKIVAEKIRSRLSEPYVLTTGHEGKTDITVEHRCTASLGVTLFNGTAGGGDDALKRADMAMYQAKASGHNAIVFYGELSCGRTQSPSAATAL